MPFYQYRGMVYRAYEKPSKGNNNSKLWHEIYSVANNQYMGNFTYSPYSYPSREDFERAVDQLLDKGRE